MPNLGSSGASGALTCGKKEIQNACPASEGTRDPNHTSTWSLTCERPYDSHSHAKADPATRPIRGAEEDASSDRLDGGLCGGLQPRPAPCGRAVSGVK
eukprot:866044-Prymnesium_polylepis.1